MARTVLAMATSHSPGLNGPVERWFTRAEPDRRIVEANGLGDYEQLAREKASWIGAEITEEKLRERYAACQQAIATLHETLARVQPQVVIVVGDDHREVFSSEHMPAFNVHWADSVFVPPLQRGRDQAGDGAGRSPNGTHVYPVDADLGRHLVHALTAEHFDVSYTRTVSEPKGLGHSFDFVCRRIMNGTVVPQVPFLLNTYYPPNRPTAKRCYDLGRALRRSVDSWASDKTVAIIGSGGLSHTIVDEDLDRAILAGMEHKSEDELTCFPESLFVDGTSEIKAWIVVGGFMAEDERQMRLVSYNPCYRSPAGTGIGNAFAYWE